MLRAVLNKSWRQHPSRHQLYGHLPSITKTIQVRRTRHAGHCWRSKDELISDVLLWTPTYGCAKAGRPARTYIQQLCEDTGCNPEDLPEAMNDREKWRERVRDIRAGGATWWWWWSVWFIHLSTYFYYIYIYIYIVIHRQTCFVLSELFSVARQDRFPMLGSKPDWLKRQCKILPLGHEETSASEGNLNAYASHLFLFTYIRLTATESSIHLKNLAWRKWQPLLPSPESSVCEVEWQTLFKNLVYG